MSKLDSLPVLLISAANESAAATVISELIDNDVTEEFSSDTVSRDRVWKLSNKYYTANVRVHTLCDGECLHLDVECIEAHVIYLTEDECAARDGGAAAAARRGAAGGGAGGGAWRRAAVRALLCAAERAPAPLRALAAARRAHLVPLRQSAASDDDEPAPARDSLGVARAREALQAHAWSGLRGARAGVSAAPRSSSGSEAEDSEPEDELRAVERAERFALALGALAPALRGVREGAGGEAGAGGEGDDAARRRRAEALVAAFCRALGHELDDC